MRREFNGFGEFEAFLDKQIAEHKLLMEQAVVTATELAHKEIVDTMGDNGVLRDLAPFTQMVREDLGYTPNDPLLRSGKLRDEIEATAFPEEGVGFVHSSDPVQKYHEEGFLNHLTGQFVAPRPAFKWGAFEAMRGIEKLMDRITRLLG